MNGVCFLPNAIDAARTLDQSNDSPRKVVVNDTRGVLKILPLRENVGRNKHARL